MSPNPTPSPLTACTEEVSVGALERSGVERVKVLRADDLEEVVRHAVAEALARGEADRANLVEHSRAVLTRHLGEARHRAAAAKRHQDMLAHLEAAAAKLDPERAELERSIAERTAKVEQLRRRAERIGAELQDEEALREEVERVKLRADRAETRNQKLEERIMQETNQQAETSGRSEELGKGLDVGTANLISAVQDTSGNLFVGTQRNAFIDIDQDDDFTRNMLTRSGVQYAEIDKKLVIVGDSAFELANIVNRETRRPMAHGVLSPDEEDALPIMRLMIERLLGKPKRAGELCYFSVPADPIDARMNAIYHEKMFQGLLTRLGYDARPQPEGHAVVLAELADDDFTGIGISCGGGMHNVCVSYKAVNVLSFSTTRGGDWIDENVAQVLGIKKSRATQLKESGIDLRHPKNREEQAVEIYYRDLISYTLRNIKERFEKKADRPTFPDPIEIVFAGGTSMIGGFAEVVSDELRKIDFPIPVRNVRRADDPLHSVAKGCLVAAMSAL